MTDAATFDGYGDGNGSGSGYGSGFGSGFGFGFGDGRGRGWWAVCIENDVAHIVHIGCRSMPIDDWLGPRGMAIAKREGTSEAEIATTRALLETWRDDG